MQIKSPGFFSRGRITLPPSPHITVATLLSDMQDTWSAGQFDVYETALIGADIVARRSGWTGVAVKLKHTPQETIILYSGLAPSVLVRMFAFGLIPLVILWFTTWKEMLEEFESYANKSPLLNPPAP